MNCLSCGREAKRLNRVVDDKLVTEVYCVASPLKSGCGFSYYINNDDGTLHYSAATDWVHVPDGCLLVMASEPV